MKTDFTSNSEIDIILVYLLFNTKQEIILREKMRHTMYNQVTLRLKLSDQLLLVIKSKDSVGKSQGIKVIN